MTRKAAIPKDPFNRTEEPQVTNVYKGTPPPELRPFDQAKGGQNVRPLVVTDEYFDNDFVPPEQPEYNFFDRKGKK